MTRPTTRGHDAGPVRRKSTLYCPECDHANAIDGDWSLRVQDATVEYACPACGTTIVERPRSNDVDSDRVASVSAWGRMVRSSIDVWRASVDATLLSVSSLLLRNLRRR